MSAISGIQCLISGQMFAISGTMRGISGARFVISGTMFGISDTLLPSQRHFAVLQPPSVPFLEKVSKIWTLRLCTSGALAGGARRSARIGGTPASRRGNSFQPGGRGSLPRAPYGWLEVGDPSGLDNCAACSRCPASKFGASRDNRPVRQCLRKGG